MAKAELRDEVTGTAMDESVAAEATEAVDEQPAILVDSVDALVNHLTSGTRGSIQIGKPVALLAAATGGAIEWADNHVRSPIKFSAEGMVFHVLNDDFAPTLESSYDMALEGAMPGLALARAGVIADLTEDVEVLGEPGAELPGLAATLDTIADTLMVPTPFSYSAGGLYGRNVGVMGKDEDEALTHEFSFLPIRVRATTRDSATGTVFGRQIEFVDVTGNVQTVMVDGKTFTSTAKLLGLLVQHGYNWKSYASELQSFLAAQRPTMVIATASVPGFYQAGSPPRQVYVSLDANNEQITLNGDPDDLLLVEGQALASPGLHQAGSQEGWNQKVYALAKPFPLAMICVGLASCLLQALGVPGGGFHFWGLSSHGKTTLLQVVASLFGCGVDPARFCGVPSFTKRFYATQNGLEAMANGHSGVPLLLDEIGTFQGDRVGDAIYMLATGQGKSRMTPGLGRAEPSLWRTVTISSGERSVRSMLLGSRQKMMEGMEGRMADVSLYGVDIFGTENAVEVVETLKLGCATDYGWAGRDLLQWVVDTPGLWAMPRSKWNGSIQRLSFPGMLPHQVRVVERLALAETAGLLAVKWGILPDTQPDEVRAAITYLRDLWLNSVPEEVQAVWGYYRDHHKRFLPLRRGIPLPPAPGYWDMNRKLLLIPKETFESTFENYVEVRRLLDGKGWLNRDKGNTHQTTRFEGGTAYGIRFAAFEGVHDLPEPPGGQG